MRTQFTLTVVAMSVAMLAAETLQADGPRKADGGRPSIPVDVAPFYNSSGPKVAVGEHGQALATADARSILDLVKRLEKEKDSLRPEVMYVAAIRLYDLGHKDEAVYWFYTAQYRARVFSSILDKAKVGGVGSDSFELPQAYASFDRLAGEYINGYAFGELPKLEKTLVKVRDEGKALPKCRDLFPGVKFVPEGTWAAKNKEVADGLSGLIDAIRTNADAIKRQRKENGVDGKY